MKRAKCKNDNCDNYTQPGKFCRPCRVDDAEFYYKCRHLIKEQIINDAVNEFIENNKMSAFGGSLKEFSSKHGWQEVYGVLKRIYR